MCSCLQHLYPSISYFIIGFCGIIQILRYPPMQKMIWYIIYDIWFATILAHSDDTLTVFLFLLLQQGTSGAPQTPRSSQKACMPLLWCWVSHALPTSCQQTRASAHCRSHWGAQSKTSSSSWSSSSWCLWHSWLACSTCTHTTWEPSTILPSPRE